MANPYFTAGPISREDLTRFFSEITINASVVWSNIPCWIWIGTLDENGYGRTRWHGPKVRLHRLMFAWLVHPLPTDPEKGTLDHLCRRRACCNPLHLEFVSRPENTRRRNAARTHCKHGHEFTPENTKIDKRNARVCIICRRRSGKEWRENNRVRYRAMISASAKRSRARNPEKWREKWRTRDQRKKKERREAANLRNQRADPQIKKEKRRAYRLKNLERIQAQENAYNARNREKRRNYAIKYRTDRGSHTKLPPQLVLHQETAP